eukprot:92956_1
MRTSCAVDWDASQSQIFMILCLSLNYHIQSMDNQFNIIKKPFNKVGVALNALIQKRMKNKEGTYVDQMFKEICNATGYGESDVMKFVLCNKNGSMRLDVLSNIFTNIKRWRIDLSGVDADAQNNVIFNDKLIHFVAKKQVQSVRFLNVLESNVTDSVAAYKEKFSCGWMEIGYFCV